MQTFRVIRHRDGQLTVYAGHTVLATILADARPDGHPFAGALLWVVRGCDNVPLGRFDYWADAKACALAYVRMLPELPAVPRAPRPIGTWVRTRGARGRFVAEQAG